jgi:hypothetical protein
MGDTGNACRIFLEIHPIDRLKEKCDYNINRDLREIGSDDGRWIELCRSY